MKAHLLIILLASTSLIAQQTEQIRPGQLYKEGSTIETPRYGFKGTIPDGYAGMLPQGTEIFLLNKTDGTSGQIMLFARPEGSLELLKENWEKGTDLTESIYLKASGEITREGDMLYAEVVGEGERINKDYKGFIIGRCGDFGPCVSLLMITPAGFYDQVKEEMIGFMRNSSFEEPSRRNPYEDFNWYEFLTNKVLVTYEMDQGAKKQNMIHLCADGTFQSNIKQTNWLKQQNKGYMGKNNGTWSVEGSGPETILHLVFEKQKIPKVEFVLSIKEEEIFVNDDRYYAGYSDRCN